MKVWLIVTIVTTTTAIFQYLQIHLSSSFQQMDQDRWSTKKNPTAEKESPPSFHFAIIFLRTMITKKQQYSDLINPKKQVYNDPTIIKFLEPWIVLIKKKGQPRCPKLPLWAGSGEGPRPQGFFKHFPVGSHFCQSFSRLETMTSLPVTWRDLPVIK